MVLELNVPAGNHTFICLTTAVNPDAPKLFQWDHPFSWYVWHGGAPASQYGLKPGWLKLDGIARLPARWNDDSQRFKHHGDGIVGKPSRSASSDTTASLARRFSGGAVTLIFKASPSQPTIWSRDEPGTTFTERWAEGRGFFAIATLRSRKCSQNRGDA